MVDGASERERIDFFDGGPRTVAIRVAGVCALQPFDKGNVAFREGACLRPRLQFLLGERAHFLFDEDLENLAPSQMTAEPQATRHALRTTGSGRRF